MEKVFRKVLHFVDDRGIIKPGDTLLASVSGGPDSVFMLHFFAYIAQKQKITVKVAYIHHHMRKEAEEEIFFVRGLAESYGFLFCRGDILLKSTSDIEQQARIQRYRQLYKIAEQQGCNKISTGHTLDDQAETMLMHLIKGTGLAGLRGILPVSHMYGNSQILLVRPLLCISKSVILETLKKGKKEYRFDSSNLSTDFFRNNIRHQVVPLLKKYNPAVIEALGRTAFLLQDDFAFLKDTSEKYLLEMMDVCNRRVSLKVYRGLPLSVKRLVVSLLCQQLTGNPYRSFDSIEKARKRLEKIGGEWLAIEQLERIIKDMPVEDNCQKEHAVSVLKVPGKIHLEKAVKVEAIETVFSSGIFTNRDRFTCYLDAEKIGNILNIRHPNKGDVFVPLGMNNPKKLARFFIDRKVPFCNRQGILVFESKGAIVWVCGLEISENFKVTQDTKRVLKISVISN